MAVVGVSTAVVADADGVLTGVEVNAVATVVRTCCVVGVGDAARCCTVVDCMQPVTINTKPQSW